jgi:hypothetical protein
MSGDEEVYVVSRDLSDVDAVAKGEGKWRRATVARLAENSCNQSCNNTQLDQQPQPGADRNLQISPKVRNHHFNMYALIPPPLIRLHVI